jgi:hypothetical protein
MGERMLLGTTALHFEPAELMTDFVMIVMDDALRELLQIIGHPCAKSVLR